MLKELDVQKLEIISLTIVDIRGYISLPLYLSVENLDKLVVDKLPSDLEGLEVTLSRVQSLLDSVLEYTESVVVRFFPISTFSSQKYPILGCRSCRTAHTEEWWLWLTDACCVWSRLERWKQTALSADS